jgi:23S rRNA G2069 N7-methylase RlmK/C1962 C5-methylase RlmI
MPSAAYCARWIAKQQGLEGVLWKFPVKRKNQKKTDRVLFGKAPSAIQFGEGDLKLTVELGEGQKSGAFLDLRGLRQWLATQDFKGKRVLNLFSYTGTLRPGVRARGRERSLERPDYLRRCIGSRQKIPR